MEDLSIEAEATYRLLLGPYVPPFVHFPFRFLPGCVQQKVGNKNLASDKTLEREGVDVVSSCRN